MFRGGGLALGTVVYELRWPCAVLEYSSGADMFSSVCHSDISLDISPESLVWSEKKKGWDAMKRLISFISLNKINFPLQMGDVPFTRADQVQS